MSSPDVQLDVCIVGLGAATAIGSTAPATAAAVRAGISTFSDHPFMIDKKGEPFVVSNAPYLAVDLGIEERFAQLALSAAAESLAPVAALPGRVGDVHAYIGLPGKRPGLPPRLATDLASRFAQIGNQRYCVCEVECLANGHSAGLMAVEAACAKIRNGTSDFCLVVGVDSYLQPETLKWIEACDQLHAPDNAWGFVPGEAGSGCLLTTPEIARRHKLPVYGTIKAVATAHEENRIKTETVCIGRGLTAAVRKVLEALPPEGPVIDDTICDQNGEAYRADEYGFTLARMNKRFVDAASFLTPADCCGDVGAASGPLFVGLAAAAAKKGYAKGPCTLIWTSSEGGERSAALFHATYSSKRVS